MTAKDYFLPGSLDEAVGLLQEHGPDVMIMAGGTLAMPLINDGVSSPELVMGLRQAGLNTITRSNGALKLGATATYSQVLASDDIPMLGEAAFHIGGWSIRNMGTVGGNLFAPPPSGDFAVALLALDAEVTLAGPNGTRTLPLSEFYTGFMTNVLEPGELVSEISVPIPAGKTTYLKFARKGANTPAVVTIAAQLVMDGATVQDARLALNAVGPYPFRATGAEGELIGKALTDETIANAAEAAMEACDPSTDAIASEWYRRKMVGVQVKRALTEIQA